MRRDGVSTRLWLMVGYLNLTALSWHRNIKMLVTADSSATTDGRKSTRRRKSHRTLSSRLESWRNIFDRDNEKSYFQQLLNDTNSEESNELHSEADDHTAQNDTKAPTSRPTEVPRQPHETDSRIIGGRPVAVGTYPAFVHSREPILCGGTLIHEDIVLTAAHCKGAFLAGVYIGGIQRYGSDGTLLDVEAEYPHPDFAPDTQFNDIMLVKLTDAASSTIPVETINMDPNRPVTNDVLTVIGYGNTAEDGSTSSELLEVEVDVFSDVFCFDLYRFYDPMTMLCAGSELGGRDSCQGDSGGPLYVAGKVQVGLTSSGSGCGIPNRPAIYTELSAFETFIRQGICDYSDNPPPSCQTVVLPTTAPVATPIVTPILSPVGPPPTASPNRNVAPTDEPTVTALPTADTLFPTSVGTATLHPTNLPTSYHYSKSKKSKKSSKGKGKGGKGKSKKGESGKGGKGMKGKKGQRRPYRESDDDFGNQLFANDDIVDDLQEGNEIFTNRASSTTTSTIPQRLRLELESRGPGI